MTFQTISSDAIATVGWRYEGADGQEKCVEPAGFLRETCDEKCQRGNVVSLRMRVIRLIKILQNRLVQLF